MSIDTDAASRRSLFTDVGRLASTAALAGCALPAVAASTLSAQVAPAVESGEWDLRWIDTLRSATDRAVFDWATFGDPADPIVLEIAERYLDNCLSAYGAGSYDARAVLKHVRERQDGEQGGELGQGRGGQ